MAVLHECETGVCVCGGGGGMALSSHISKFFPLRKNPILDGQSCPRKLTGIQKSSLKNIALCPSTLKDA